MQFGILREAEILLAAACYGHAEVVRFLVTEVGIPLVRDVLEGITSLHAACWGDHEGVVEALLELGADVRVVCKRRIPEFERMSRLTPLGVAVYSGSTSCMRKLAVVAVGDGGDPSAVTLAAWLGQAGVVRFLLRRFPAANTDEAFSLAVVEGERAVAKLLSPRSCFAWTDRSWDALWRQGDERVVRLLSRYPLDEAGSQRIRPETGFGEFGILEGLELLLRVKRPTRELAESMLRVCGCELDEPGMRVSDALSRLFLSLPLRASRVLPTEVSEPWVFERILGPARWWDVDAYEHCDPEAWAWLVRASVPLVWLRHEDGAEYCPLFEICSEREEEGNGVFGAGGVMDFWPAFHAALKAAGVDMSRHHYCDRGRGCGCGWQKQRRLRRFLRECGATPCSARREGRRREGVGSLGGGLA
jgi:hypothetical protein